MTLRRLVIDGPARLVDVTTAAVRWLDARVTWGLVLIHYAYLIVLATVLIAGLVLILLTLTASRLGLPWGRPPAPPAVVVPTGSRAAGDAR